MYNMLEIGDRLLASFGQDVMDSLYYSCMQNQTSYYVKWPVVIKNSFLPFLLAVVYIFAHTGLLLTQVTVLNVAFNSHNKVLLIIMMSNNFIELKGTVFKKFEAANLFQISCADCRERLQLFFMMYIVLVRNFSSKFDLEQVLEILPYMAGIIFSEFFIDWMKHSFIIKFNHIKFNTTYKEYCTLLANDIVLARIEGQTSHQGQHSAVDQICRRTGFSCIPIAVLIIEITLEACYKMLGSTKWTVILFLSFLILLEWKFMVSILLNVETKKYHNVIYEFAGGSENGENWNGTAVPICRTFSNSVIPNSGKILDPFEQQIRKPVGGVKGEVKVTAIAPAMNKNDDSKHIRKNLDLSSSSKSDLSNMSLKTIA